MNSCAIDAVKNNVGIFISYKYEILNLEDIAIASWNIEVLEFWNLETLI